MALSYMDMTKEQRHMEWKEAKIRENRDWREKIGDLRETTVEGHTYKYWGDTYFRGMYAEDENGIIRMIHSSGYITNDLTVRKAIAATFGHDTFRK